MIQNGIKLSSTLRFDYLAIQDWTFQSWRASTKWMWNDLETCGLWIHTHLWQTWTESIQLLSITGLQLVWMNQRKGLQLLITENNLNFVTAAKVFLWSLQSQGLLANYRTVQTAPWYTHTPISFSVSFLVVSEIDGCKEEAAGGYRFFAIWLALFLPLSCSVCIAHTSTLLLCQFCLRSMRRLRAAHLVLMNQDFMLPGGKQDFHYDFLWSSHIKNIEKLDMDLKPNLKTHKTELREQNALTIDLGVDTIFNF